MDGRTTKRQYSEYSDFFLTQREPEYDQDTDLQQQESTHVRWGGQDGRREPDSGMGYTQDYGSRWTHENYFNPDSVSQRTEQPASHERGAEDRPTEDRIPEETDRHADSRWDIPRKRALFTSDGTDSTTIGSNTPESHADRPPEVKCSEGLITDKRQSAGGAERLCSSHIQLEMAVNQLHRDVEECRAERELARNQTPAVTLRPQRQSGYTSTPVQRYSGKSNSTERCSRPLCVRMAGTMSRRPYSCYPIHGDALNVALLVPESRRVKPGFLIKSLSEHYSAPGRLAEYKCQLQRAVRRPGDDPSIFATELQMLVRRASMDIDLKIQLQMVRYRFIDGQAECALRRHLDSLGPNTPIPDIVDCCRIWERHCEVEIQPQTGADRRPVRVIDPYDGRMPDSRRVVSVFCLRDGRRNTFWDRVPNQAPGDSRRETPTHPGKGAGRPDQ